MKKETFINAIEAFEKQYHHDIKVSESLVEAFPCAHTANLLPDNHYISNALMRVLQEAMDDQCENGQSWIEWFCFEKDFGKNKILQAFDEKGNEIKMNTPEDLYNFLLTK